MSTDAHSPASTDAHDLEAHIPSARIPTSAFDDVDAQARTFLAANSAPALAYAVVHDGRIVHAGGVGESRVGGPAPDERSVFRIASMTKSFTAAAVLILRDEGRLRLDDAVDQHIPQLRGLRLPTQDSRMPTVRDLLTMSAGWATDDPWADREESMSPTDYDALLAEGFTFNFAPGTGFEYSNLGYTMLGRLITNVSGVRYQRFVTERILRPLGMTSTAFTAEELDPVTLADGHYLRGGAWLVEPTAPTGEFAPLGGLFSSCADLARWVSIMAGAFPARDDADPAVPLSRASLREMQQGYRVLAPSVAVVTAGQPLWLNSPAYGFGLLIAEDPVRGTVVGHSGGYPGYGTHMCWHPETGIGVVALANGRYGGAFRAATAMLRSVLDAAGSPSRVIAVTAATSRARTIIDRILDSWDDTELDALVSANVDADVPRALRRADAQEAIAAVGPLLAPSGAGEATSTAQSHLVWWRDAVRGRLRVEVRLTPQNPQRVQTLNIRAVPEPSTALAAAAHSLVAAFNAVSEPGRAAEWPDRLVTHEGVDTGAVLAMTLVARALEPAASFRLAEHPCAAASADSATFELHRGNVVWELVLAVDAESGAVTSCALAQRPLNADARAVVLPGTAGSHGGAEH